MRPSARAAASARRCVGRGEQGNEQRDGLLLPPHAKQLDQTQPHAARDSGQSLAQGGTDFGERQSREGIQGGMTDRLAAKRGGERRKAGGRARHLELTAGVALPGDVRGAFEDRDQFRFRRGGTRRGIGGPGETEKKRKGGKTPGGANPKSRK